MSDIQTNISNQFGNSFKKAKGEPIIELQKVDSKFDHAERQASFNNNNKGVQR
jgi:hypothetical protein